MRNLEISTKNIPNRNTVILSFLKRFRRHFVKQEMGFLGFNVFKIKNKQNVELSTNGMHYQIELSNQIQ